MWERPPCGRPSVSSEGKVTMAMADNYRFVCWNALEDVCKKGWEGKRGRGKSAGECRKESEIDKKDKTEMEEESDQIRE